MPLNGGELPLVLKIDLPAVKMDEELVLPVIRPLSVRRRQRVVATNPPEVAVGLPEDDVPDQRREAVETQVRHGKAVADLRDESHKLVRLDFEAVLLVPSRVLPLEAGFLVVRCEDQAYSRMGNASNAYRDGITQAWQGELWGKAFFERLAAATDGADWPSSISRNCSRRRRSWSATPCSSSLTTRSLSSVSRNGSWPGIPPHLLNRSALSSRGPLRTAQRTSRSHHNSHDPNTIRRSFWPRYGSASWRSPVRVGVRLRRRSGTGTRLAGASG